MNINLNCSPAYYTSQGAAFCGDAKVLLSQIPDNTINLVITSPPFALLRQKEYGNEQQKAYVDWLLPLAALIYRKLRDDGSFVLDLGGAYKRGYPVRSLYNFRVLLALCDDVGFHLAEGFYWFNPSKLPSPIEWVNKRKIRAKDSVNTIWWFSKGEFPKANVSNVLVEYSDRMKKLLEDPEKFYTPKDRPSGHQISKHFAKDNGGSIPSNLLSIPNSDSNSPYLRGCKSIGVKPHPARFPSQLPEFFIRFLTEPDDWVVDIFAGSNTSGMVTERENRQWFAFEQDLSYLATSAFRFLDDAVEADTLQHIYDAIQQGESVNIADYLVQKRLL